VHDATGAVFREPASPSPPATEVALRQTTTERNVSFPLFPGTYQIKVEAAASRQPFWISWSRLDASRLGPALEVGSRPRQSTWKRTQCCEPTQTGLEGIVTEDLIRDLPLTAELPRPRAALNPASRCRMEPSIRSSKTGSPDCLPPASQVAPPVSR